MTNQGVTVSDYLKWVKDVHNVDGPFENSSMFQSHVYFRGHASKQWELLPSLFRDSGRIHDEHKMLFMASNMLWTELGDCKSDLEKLIRLQHYGLKTRLLDVTFNPLVALYFACQILSKDHDTDGVVYCGYKENDNNNANQVIAEYVFNNDVVSINRAILEKICQKRCVNQKEMETIHFITPPLNNPRISIQNGAFIMSPLLKRNAVGPFINASHNYIKKEMKTAFDKHFDIPACSKPAILKELDYLGFNRATIYTDISNKLQYINDREDKDGWPNLDI